MVLVLCLSQVVFAQKKSEYKGIPMRDVEPYSLTFPLTVAVTVETQGVAGRVFVEVDCIWYKIGADYSMYIGDIIDVIRGYTDASGLIMNSKTITLPSRLTLWELRIGILGLTQMYQATIQLTRVGFIDVDVTLRPSGVSGTLKDAAGYHVLEFK